MFSSWKRQRREVECTALGGGAATAAAAAASRGAPLVEHPPSSCGSFDCGESSDCSGRDVVAAAAQRLQLTPRRGGSEGGSPSSAVRQKAAFFEALIRSNTNMLVQCTASGVQQQEFGQDGEDAEMLHGDSDCEATEHWAVQQRQQQRQEQQGPGPAQGGAGCSREEESEGQEYSEVQMMLRIPRLRAPPPISLGSGRFGDPQQMEALIEQLQCQLAVREQQQRAAASALARKSQECANLTRVVKELSESRAKAVSARATLSERYQELQTEFHRMLRITELSRTVSKENMAKSSKSVKALKDAQLELHATRKQATTLHEKTVRVNLENVELKEKITVLERLDLDQLQESVCMQHFTRRISETY